MVSPRATKVFGTISQGIEETKIDMGYTKPFLCNDMDAIESTQKKITRVKGTKCLLDEFLSVWGYSMDDVFRISGFQKSVNRFCRAAPRNEVFFSFSFFLSF